LAIGTSRLEDRFNLVHRNVRAVVAAAERQGLVIEPRSFSKGTKTAGDAAAAIGVKVGQIVKSLVFLVDGKPTMALVGGDNRLDEAKLAAAVGGAQVERPNGDTVRAATGFPIGGVPPVGHDVPVYVDEGLLRYGEVWAAAGTWTDVFAITPAELVRITDGIVASLAG
jgi:prolyl-tRNA editing enzyme YbaK/EbsC (Cys-tRNA(Pro) deacylase)